MEYSNILQELLYAVIIVVLPLVTKYALKLLKAWTNKITDKCDNDELSDYISYAYQIVEDVVTMVNQTYVDSLKKSGSFTAEAQSEAKNLALSKANTLISSSVAGAIEIMYGDFNEWLDTTIEAFVSKLKEE